MYKLYSRHAVLLNALLIVAIITLLGFPGQMSYDSFYTLREAREGVSGGSYPPMHAYILRFFDAIYPGPLLLWMSQNVLLIVSLAAIIDKTLLADKSDKTALLFLILFIPPVLGPMLTVWKDVLLTSLLTCSVAIAVYLRDVRLGCLKWFLLTFGYLVLVLASCVRLNALPATIALLYAPMREVFGKRSCVFLPSFVVLCAMMLGSAFYLNNFRFMTFERFSPVNNFVRAPVSWTFVYDIIGVAKYSKQEVCFSDVKNDCLSSECAGVAFSGDGIFETLSNLRRCDQSGRDAIYRNLDPERLQPLWLSVVPYKIIPYLSARVEYVSSLLGIGGRAPYQVSQNWTPPSTAISLPSTSPGNQSAVAWDAGLEEGRLPEWVVTYLDFLSNGLGVKAWLVLSVAGIVVGSRLFFGRTTSRLSIGIFASVVGYFIPFVFLGADAGTRYLHWVLVGSALAAIVVEIDDHG